MTVDEYVQTIKVKEEDIKKLKKECDELYKSAWNLYLSENPDHSVFEKFERWAKFGPKTKHYILKKVYKSRSGKKLFDYEAPPLYCEKNQTLDADYVIMGLNNAYAFWKLNKKPFKNSRLPTDEDIADWMQQIMDDDFGSMVYDW